MAKSHVRDGVLAVEMLQAFLQMNVKVAPGIVVIEGVAGAAGFVLQAIRRFYVYVHAADGANKLFCGVNAQDHIPIEWRDPEPSSDDALRLFDASVGLRLIDLGLSAVGHCGDHVAGDR